MASQVSPGILVQEVDKTLAIPQILPPVGAIAGHFAWGPIEEVVTVSSEDVLVSRFGKPGANSADYFFTAANFLSYSNALRVVRVANSLSARAATSSPNDVPVAGATFTINTSSLTITAASGNTAGLVAGMTLLIGNSATDNVRVTVASLNPSDPLTGTLVALPTAAVTAGNAFAYGLYVKNQDQYLSSYADGSQTVGQWAAKYSGSLGNSLRVELCGGANAFSQATLNATHGVANTQLTVGSGNTTVVLSDNVVAYVQVGDIITANNEQRQVMSFVNNSAFVINVAFSTALSSKGWARKWKYSSLFGSAPGTSNFAAQRGGSSDEVHVVVVDEDGLVTGAANTVLEKYAFLSKASDAKNDVGSNLYYKDVLNNQSAYVWWLDHPTGATGWGETSAGRTFAQINLVQGGSLVGGVDGGAISNNDLTRGYDMFVSEEVDVDMVLGASANSALATYVISQVVGQKPYTMGFFSPSPRTTTSGNEVSDAITYRSSLPSTSYAVLDSGWKYQYDKYNDVYRYVPLNGDVAGCLVRTTQQSESWFSPAGFTRGQIKNVVKLAFNPKQIDRDDLYLKGINPVVTFPGQGTVLFGDKTLLSKPTAFDRINVRRLFIVLEKTIETAAKQLLFEQNDEFTRNQFVNLVEPFLRQVKGRRGISDFQVVCDETNNPPDAVDRNEFRADVYVKPVRSINFIQLNVVAVRSDVSFNEIITNLQ